MCEVETQTVNIIPLLRPPQDPEKWILLRVVKQYSFCCVFVYFVFVFLLYLCCKCKMVSNLNFHAGVGAGQGWPGRTVAGWEIQLRNIFLLDKYRLGIYSCSMEMYSCSMEIYSYLWEIYFHWMEIYSYLLDSSELGVREPGPDGCCGLKDDIYEFVWINPIFEITSRIYGSK